MRYGSIFRDCNIYPSYEEILQCKYKCRVQELSVSDTIVKVPLQNHITKRIVYLQQEVMFCAIESANDNKFIREITQIFFSFPTLFFYFSIVCFLLLCLEVNKSPCVHFSLTTVFNFSFLHRVFLSSI